MFEVLKDEICRRLPPSLKQVLLSWYRNALLHPYFLALLAFMVLCWFGWALFGKIIVNWWVGEADKPYENAGQLGDSFGILNTLFAGIAALGATFAYLAQSKQLRDAQAAAKDAKAAEDKRQFESTFFQFLNVFTETRSSIVIRDEDENNNPIESRGCEAIRCLQSRFNRYLYPEDYGILFYDDERDLGSSCDAVARNYLVFSSRNSQHLSHYFRVLYRILSYVANSNRPDSSEYAKVVRAVLSDSELSFLFYTTLVDKGNGMKRFVNDFSLLKHLPIRKGFPNREQREWLGNEKGQNGEEISPAYCDKEDRAAILAKGVTGR